MLLNISFDATRAPSIVVSDPGVKGSVSVLSNNLFVSREPAYPMSVDGDAVTIGAKTDMELVPVVEETGMSIGSEDQGPFMLRAFDNIVLTRG